MKRLANFLMTFVFFAFFCCFFSCSDTSPNDDYSESDCSLNGETWLLCEFSSQYSSNEYTTPVSWGEYLKFQDGTLYWNSRLGNTNTTYKYEAKDDSYTLYSGNAKSYEFSIIKKNDKILILHFSDELYRYYIKSNVQQASKTYTITFDPNGGTVKETSQSISPDSSAALKSASELGLKRDGYIFKGWATSKDAKAAQYSDTGLITTVDDVTLYAVWAYKVSYKITFNANNGSLTVSDQIIKGETVAGNISAKLTDSAKLGITREGFIFKGWSSKNNATTVEVSDAGTIDTDGDITLYAVWAYTVTYKINFSENGGSISTTSQTVTAETITGDLSVNIKTSTILNLSRSGYKFKGWSPSASSSSVDYADGGAITLSSDKTLYAVWDKIISYTITFNANGGSISTRTQTATGTESEGVQVRLYTASALGLSKSGYVFTGWTCGSSTISNGAIVTLTGNATLYANWALPQYTITYVMDRQSYGQLRAPQVTRKVTGVTSITLPSASSLGYSKSGYNFLGWSTSQSSTSYYPYGNTISISSDTKLYAVWQELYIYVRLYHPGYTSSSGAKFGTMAVSVGGKSDSVSLNMRNGYYTSNYMKLSGVSGSCSWATSFVYQKTGYKATSVTKSGYYTFTNGGRYTINVSTGAITRN